MNFILANSSDCPLSGIPIVFNDSETFFPIASQASPIKGNPSAVIYNKTCNWSFTVPDGNDLKVVIRYSNHYFGEALNVQSDGGDLVK